jgi:hypothetical protein
MDADLWPMGANYADPCGPVSSTLLNTEGRHLEAGGREYDFPRRLQVDQEAGISGRHIVHLHHVGPRHQLLQLGHTQPVISYVE